MKIDKIEMISDDYDDHLVIKINHCIDKNSKKYNCVDIKFSMFGLTHTTNTAILCFKEV